MVGTRIWQLVLPQNAILPAIRIQLITVLGNVHLMGETNLFRTRIQIDAYAGVTSGGDPYRTASDLAAAVHGNWLTTPVTFGLQGWRGDVGGTPPAIAIRGISRVDREPFYEAEERQLIRMRQDYYVMWKWR